MSKGLVLITGGSGFIAGHCILRMLSAGYTVRATLRSLAKEHVVRATLAEAGMTLGDRLEFVAADLTRDDGWAEAMQGVDLVLHVASPVMPGHVENEDDLIVPAVDGTLRVLHAAAAAGARRVVLTSAFHAVSWGHPHDEHVFTEADWTVLDGPGVDAYGKSKTLAERAAWDWVDSDQTSLELVALLPVAVMGPVMGAGVSGANHLIQGLLEGANPGLPHLFIPIVDVRDVAEAHLLAATNHQAPGRRFLLSNGAAVEMPEIAAMIREALGPAAAKVPTEVIPNAVVRARALTDPQLRAIVPDLGYAKRTSNDEARSVLGWHPRAPREAVVAAAESMVRANLAVDD